MSRVEVIVDSIRQDLLHYEWVVILKERSAERYLPICVGSTQADIIKSLPVGTEPIETADYDLSVPGVDTTGAGIKSVIISRFKNNIFYAKLLFSRHNKSHKVDCPVAKAIALGIKEGAPIFAEEALLNKYAINVRD